MSALRAALQRPGALVAARWALGIGALGLVVVGLNGGETVARMASADGALVVAGVLGLTAVHALGAAAWSILCRQLGELRMDWATGLRVYYAAQALGGITPANVGGDAYRIVAVRSTGLGWGAAVAPVVVQRASSYLALTLLALPALAWLTASSRLPTPILAGGIVLCGLAAGLAIALLVAPTRLAELGARLPRNRAQRNAAVPHDPDRFARPPIASVALATGLGLAFHLVSVLLTALLVAAVDPSATGLSVLAAITVARLSIAVPVLPSGLGANEAVLAVIFAGLALSPQTALAALLLGRVALVLTTVLGTGLLLFGRPTIRRGDARSVASAP